MRILLSLALIAACGERDIDPPTPPPPDAPDTPRFEPDPTRTPALRIAGTFEGDELAIEIRADELGDVFGIAGRLEFDPAQLAVKEAALTPDLLPDGVELLRDDAGAIVFGVARKGPALGDVPLGSAVLATVRFTALAGKDARLALSRAMVRRADGSFVPAAFLGAAVHTAGGAQ